MTETRLIETEEGDDLIPQDQLPTDPADLDGGATATRTDGDEPDLEPAAPDGAPEEKLEVHSQPKPVEGETPKERALRLEVQRLRGEVRKNQVGSIVETKQPVAPDAYQALRDKGYSEEEIANMESAVDIIATQKGYVRADRTYAQTVQDTVDLFTEEHPEYKATNDVEDVRWNMFQSLLKDGTYNLSGKTAKQLKSIFEKVDNDVRKELGEVVVKRTPVQVAAAQHKASVVSHSAGGAISPSTTPRPKLNTKQAGGVKLVGFDDDDFA